MSNCYLSIYYTRLCLCAPIACVQVIILNCPRHIVDGGGSQADVEEVPAVTVSVVAIVVVVVSVAVVASALYIWFVSGVD